MKLLVLAGLLALAAAETKKENLIDPFKVDWYALDQCYGLTKEMIYDIEQDLAQHKPISEVHELLYDMIVLNKLKCPANGKKYRAQPDWTQVQQCYYVSSTQFKKIEAKIKNNEKVPDYQLPVISAIIKNRFRCDNSRPTNDPPPENIDWLRIEECYGRSQDQLNEILRQMNSGGNVPKEDADILDEIKKNRMQCPPYFKEANKYNTIYWEKVDDDIFEQCFGMTKDDFSLNWNTTGAFVFSGHCTNGEDKFDLPRVPFMGLLKDTLKNLQNQNISPDGTEDLLAILTKKRENLSKRKSSGRWWFLSKKMLEELDE